MPDTAPPPPKGPSIDEAMAIILQLVTTVTSLVSKIDGLVDTVKTLTETITASQSTSSPSFPPATSSFPPVDSRALIQSAYEAAASALRDAKMIEDKGTRAVIVGLREGSNKEETAKEDQKIIKALCEWSDDTDVMKSFEEGGVTFHRHPPNSTSDRRPTKVQFASKDLRDRFLSGIRRKGGRPPPLKNNPGSYARRDLTPTELEIERERKIEVKQKNLAAGKIVFGLRDTDVISYRTPHPLPPNYGHSPIPNTSAADVSFSGVRSPLNHSFSGGSSRSGGRGSSNGT